MTYKITALTEHGELTVLQSGIATRERADYLLRTVFYPIYYDHYFAFCIERDGE